MTRILLLMSLAAALVLPALCQNGRLSPDDQREFDKAYTHWVNDTRKNDRDDVDRDVRRMQDIMSRNNIPSDTPYEQIASSGYGQQDQDRYNDGYQQNTPYGANQGRLSPEDQREFDRVYDKWVNDSRRNDRDDIDRDVRRMQDIMARNNIPQDVPYDQIATSGSGNGYRPEYDNRGRGAYNNDRGYSQSRLSPEDQHEFDKTYDKWQKDVRKHDRDDVRREERKMQDIMARYNIPRDVPYDQVASPEYRH